MISPARCYDAAIADGTNTVSMVREGDLTMDEALASIAQALWHFICGPGEDLGEYFLWQRCSSHCIRLYIKIQEEDQPFSETEKDENNYFQNKDLRNTIAKKLTLMSEWKTQYSVKNLPRLRKDILSASPNPWKWIQQFMQD